MERTVSIAAATATNSPTNPPGKGPYRASLLVPVPGSPRTTVMATHLSWTDGGDLVHLTVVHLYGALNREYQFHRGVHLRPILSRSGRAWDAADGCIPTSIQPLGFLN